MTLCKHRPEGFGPKSAISSNLPTTCFADVIVVPLATWIYMLIISIGLIGFLSRSRRHASTTTADNSVAEKYTSLPQESSQKKSWIKRTAQVIYYVLIVCMIAMLSLEIARLSVAELGIGLLPFTYVGVLLALLNHVGTNSKLAGRYFASSTTTGRGRNVRKWTARVINALFWAMLLCAMAIKVAALVKEEDILGKRTGVQSKYPLSDSVTDNATMVGVEFVLLILEFVTV